jgi:hypothetical protein
LWPAKLNQARLDGEPHKRFGFALASQVVNACDEFAKREGFLPAMNIHGLKCKPGNRAEAMGCNPTLYSGDTQTPTIHAAQSQLGALRFLGSQS